MSIISSRPKVQKISGPILTSVAAAGAVLAASALKSLIGSLANRRREAQRSAMPTEEGLRSVVELRERFLKRRQENLEQAQGRMPAVEALRAATLASLDSTPFYIEHPDALRPYSQALEKATTLAEVKKAESGLLEALANQHQQVFTNTLALACQRAAARVGFDQIEMIRLPKELRVVASDTAGRAIVSEIRADVRRETSMASEVVGVLDGSCQKILHDFDEALEQEGVRSAPPDRKFTGGVCELAAAREIARNRWKPLTKTMPAKIAKQSAPVSRARRLNAAAKTTVQTKG